MRTFSTLLAAILILTFVAWSTRVGAAETHRRFEDIHTEDTAIRFSLGGKLPSIVRLGTKGHSSWAAGSPEACLPTAVTIDDKVRHVQWNSIKSSRTEISPEAQAIVFEYESADPPLKATSTWSAVHGPGPVEHEVVLTNASDSTITFRFPATIAIELKPQADHKIQHWWVDKGAGNMPMSGGTYAKPIEAGYHKTQFSGPYSEDDENRDAIPWCAIQDTQAETGIYGGIEFSGWTEIDVQRTAVDKIALSMGMKVRGQSGGTRLKPGESYRFPTCFIGVYGGSVDDGCNRLHRWVETHLRPPVPGGITPLLVNNSWGSGMIVDEQLARKMIDECDDLGMELFQVDAGWYRDVGDWHPNPQKFPDGLAPIADYAHLKKLKFGLWVGWTQGGASKDNNSDVLSVFNPAQKNWFGRDLPPDWKNQEFIGEPVCLGCNEARDWCLGELRRMIKNFKLDLLEHDQDMMLDVCDRVYHDHLPDDPVDVSRATAEGYYEIYDQLRKENPNLLFEDCVNGGRLVDFGVAKRVHYICVTDTYDPQTCRRAFYDASYPLPPSMIELYLENVPGNTNASFTSMLRSAMLGWATIMLDTTKWNAEQRAIAKQEFAIYKERLRPLIATANLYHILPRPNGKRWDGIQYHDPATHTGVTYIFRSHAKEPTQIVNLRGLDSSMRYKVEPINGSTPSQVRTGKELMETGLPIHIDDEDGSDLIFLHGGPD